MSTSWSEIEGNHPLIHLDNSITVAIAAYGNADATLRCLEALFKSADGNYELILIDDNSPDDGATFRLFDWASQTQANTKIYQNIEENIEYSGSVSLALSHGQGEKIFFISNDIYVTPYYFQAILMAADASPLNGIIRGSSNYVDNGLPSHNIPHPQAINNLGSIFGIGKELFDLFRDTTAPDPFLVGDAFMVNRDLLDKIGVFDPLFFGYFADHDLGIRSKIAGFNNLLVPGAYAYHDAHVNFNYLPPEQAMRKNDTRWERVYENWARFKLKYGLPVSLQYTTTHDIPWEQLEQEEFNRNRHFATPQNFNHLKIN